MQPETRTILLLVGIALFIPLLLVSILILSNPAISPAVFKVLLGGMIFAAFLALFAFEIKRIADE